MAFFVGDNGYIYGSKIGGDVSKLVPNEHLTQKRDDAANVEDQPKLVWPANFIVARAYLDQLNRSGSLRRNALRW